MLMYALTFVGWLGGLHCLRGVSAEKRFLTTKTELVDEPPNPTVEWRARQFKVLFRLCLAYVGASLVGTRCTHFLDRF
jgi:hypothetical protein